MPVSRTAEYVTWQAMLDRCRNPNNSSWPRYGGRGITVCERWRNSFANFLADMGPRPSDDRSIDRIDNNGNYEPDNCRWATRLEQARNRCSNRLTESNGRMIPMSQWFEENPDRRMVRIPTKYRTPLEKLAAMNGVDLRRQVELLLDKGIEVCSTWPPA